MDDMLINSSHLLKDDNLFFDPDYPRTWPYGIVPYEISHHLCKLLLKKMASLCSFTSLTLSFADNSKALIEKAMKHISAKVPCISFVPRYYEDFQDFLYIIDSPLYIPPSGIALFVG